MKQLDETTLKQININDSIFVEISDKGFEHIDQTYVSLYGKYGSSLNTILPSDMIKQYREVMINNQIMYELQLWEFMQYFGDIMAVGVNNYEYFNFNPYINN